MKHNESKMTQTGIFLMWVVPVTQPDKDWKNSFTLDIYN